MSIVFDTETTGLPIMKGFGNYYSPSDLMKYDSSRMVQLAYIVLDDFKNVVKRVSRIVKPEGFAIQNSHIHHITQEKAEKEGEKLEDVLKAFAEDLKTCKTLVAHNIAFDVNIVLAECYRLNLLDVVDAIKGCERYCTMWEGKRVLHLIKLPKLVNLYERLCNKKWEQIHDALDDAEKCLACYLVLSVKI